MKEPDALCDAGDSIAEIRIAFQLGILLLNLIGVCESSLDVRV